MNSIVDIVVIGILIAATLWGAWKGFIIQLVSLLGLLAGIWAASKLTVTVADWCRTYLPDDASDSIVRAVIFVLILILVIFICSWIGKIIDKAVKLTILSGINRILGAVFCLLKVGIILIALASLTGSVITVADIEPPAVLKQSSAYEYLNSVADNILPFIKNMFTNLKG